MYDPEAARRFLDFYAERYGPVEIPILVGVLPLNNPRHAAFLHHEVPGITIPEPIMRRLEQAGERAPWEGVRIALEIIERLRPWAQGIYLMPQFRRYDLAAEIVEGARRHT